MTELEISSSACERGLAPWWELFCSFYGPADWDFPFLPMHTPRSGRWGESPGRGKMVCTACQGACSWSLINGTNCGDFNAFISTNDCGSGDCPSLCALELKSKVWLRWGLPWMLGRTPVGSVPPPENRNEEIPAMPPTNTHMCTPLLVPRQGESIRACPSRGVGGHLPCQGRIIISSITQKNNLHD